MTHATVKSALEQEFEDACMSDVEECSKLGYYPHYFVEMVHQHGAVETAKRLIRDQHVPAGFTRLWEMKRLDMTLEACIHDNPKFHSLFDSQTLAACNARLASVGYI
jgi:hypothetical protein